MNVQCIDCRKVYDIPVTVDAYQRWLNHGELAQRAFPSLTADQREILISGLCGSCFDETCPPEDD